MNEIDFRCLDDIIIGYMVSILEELGQNPNDFETTFDLDDFTGMMTEFIPGFQHIDRFEL